MGTSGDFHLTQPLTFTPLFMERIWGGRDLETLFAKPLPPSVPIGESWEIVDRPEAQSIVRGSELCGQSLQSLWQEHRREIFGKVDNAERFPLLIKLLDAREKLSVQVHPPPAVAAQLGGEAKTEFWYIAKAAPGAEVFVGLKKDSSRSSIEEALIEGQVEEHLHRVSVRTGDAMFLPSGRVHAIGAGSVIVEIQENSDTTYRVFDWNRLDATGAPRALHLEESMRSIDFDDHEPALIAPGSESLVRHDLFHVDKWNLGAPRSAVEPGRFAIIGCLTGRVSCAKVTLNPGEFFLVPACLTDRVLQPAAENTSLLRVTIPARGTS